MTEVGNSMKKNCTGQNSWGNIKGFSNALHKVLGIVAIVYPIFIVMHILSELWRIFGWNVEVITVGGWQPFVIDIQILRIGQSAVFIPATTLGIPLYGASTYTPDATTLNVVLTIVLLILAQGFLFGAILYFKKLFKELKNGASPFSHKMVGRILTLTIFITVFAIFNITVTNVIFLVFAWLMYYIFDYGRKLQEESDTTL
ncbi:MAG: hypothetical protein FWB88_07840 [Defluviitaleaceae bacterium]|nr:hypothetical protein [Defluviitaleaceae bacterium]MCL2240107.1 hypothetical protein [Defluviitaleaceae bacterium]